MGTKEQFIRELGLMVVSYGTLINLMQTFSSRLKELEDEQGFAKMAGLRDKELKEEFSDLFPENKDTSRLSVRVATAMTRRDEYSHSAYVFSMSASGLTESSIVTRIKFRRAVPTDKPVTNLEVDDLKTFVSELEDLAFEIMRLAASHPSGLGREGNYYSFMNG